MIPNALKNWKTTSAGLTLIIGLGVHLVFVIRSGTATEAVWTSTLIGFVTGIGLLFAGDAGASASKTQFDTLTDAVRTGDTSMLTKSDPK